MPRRIKQIAVIGSGIMGSGIACHFANIGVQVLLLDITPQSLTDDELSKNLSLELPQVRNRIASENLAAALKLKPSPIYHQKFAGRITVGNLTDNLPEIKNVDWIIEVVVEQLEIKKNVFQQIEQYRTPGTLITSNTSGIPIQLMCEGRSTDFKQHFCGTHFFNPARYLKLFEIIPGTETAQEVVDFVKNYAENYLGKTAIIAKDTPAFIGNRIGIFSIMNLLHLVNELHLTIEEVDKLTGPVIGNPKSATFRTVDVVGLDTLAHVAKGLYDHTQDEANHLFQLPDFILKMLENNWLGSKTGQGFYKKEGKEIYALDLSTLQYQPQKKVNFATLEQTKKIEKVIDRFPVLVSGTDKAADFYRKNFGGLFAYVANRIPEISNELYKIDDAMKAGFGWELGPFEIWDAIGISKGIELIKAAGYEPAKWVIDLHNQQKSFYHLQNGKNLYFDISAQKHVPIPGQDAFIILNHIRQDQKIWENNDAVITHLGDGILNLEFRSKMNTIGAGVLQGINKAIDVAEKEYNGLVIANQGPNFTVGANIMMIFMMAVEQEYDELNMAIKFFQDTMMRVRYSAIPVIVAPHSMTFGGGCELAMHADKIVAAAETYMGLVEFGVGVIPGGGGSKELTLRASDSFKKNDVELNTLQEHFLTIAMAKVSTSAYEAFDLNLLQKGKDLVVVNQGKLIAAAKKQALILAESGYTQPIKRSDIKVLGKQALGMFMVGTHSMEAGKFISEHDKKIADKLAWVMAGGDLSEPTLVNEQYLLDLEREAFLSLCTERKTLERIQHMLTKGKSLRN